MSRIRVLAFLDNPLGRDTEIILPIGHGLESYLNCQVKYKFIWDLFEIKLWQPDVLLLPNTRGHHMYVEAAHYAWKHKIIILALDSEGNFRTDYEYDIWGYNTKQLIYQDWLTCWSQRTANYIAARIGEEDKEKLVITGGSGFDKYSFGRFKTRAEILSKYKKQNFEKVIGYAGWCFGKLYNSQRKVSFKRYFDGDQKKAYSWVEEQRVYVRDTLRYLIEKYPNILFILKKHPKEEFEDEPEEGKNEMNELLHYGNVLYLKNEEPIQDIIAISDVWTGFETTTLFEAWMLKKPTILINQHTNFPRSSHYKGAIIGKNKEAIGKLIDEFYKLNNLDRHVSSEMLNHRVQAVKNSIGYSDGLNHLRALYYFRESLPSYHKQRNLSLSLRHLRLYILMHLGRLLYSKQLFKKMPKFRKTIYVFENRTMPGLEERKHQVYSDLNDFHKNLGITEKLKENDWESLQELLHIQDF